MTAPGSQLASLGRSSRRRRPKTSGAILLSIMLSAAPARAQTAGPPAGPPPAVTVAPVVVKDIAPAQTFVGRVVAIETVQIVPRVTAFIEEVAVKQGSDVKAGQVLFRLEQTQYTAAVQAAQAQLASANAALVQAERAYDRAAELAQRNVETQANLDQARATRDQGRANVQA